MPKNNFGAAFERFPKLAEQRQLIADEVVSRMENGEYSNWVQNFSAVGAPYNPVTKNVYHGVNRSNLSLFSLIRGYSDPRWVTWNNVRKNNWKIKDGQQREYAYVEHWERVAIPVEDENGEIVVDDNGQPEISGYYLRLNQYSKVYNAEQVDGIPPLPKPELSDNPDVELSKIADDLIFSSRCPVVETLKSDPPCYSPAKDEISMPQREQYDTNESFLGDLLHEMAHSTSHESALGRETFSRYSDHEGYAHEELIAEFSALFSCADLGIGSHTSLTEGSRFDNHVAYLVSWAKAISEDPKILYDAVAAADASTEFIIDRYDNVLSTRGDTREVAYNLSLDLQKSVIARSVETPDLGDFDSADVGRFTKPADSPSSESSLEPEKSPASFPTEHTTPVEIKHIDLDYALEKIRNNESFGYQTEEELRTALIDTGMLYDFEINEELSDISKNAQNVAKQTAIAAREHNLLAAIAPRDVQALITLTDFNNSLDELMSYIRDPDIDVSTFEQASLYYDSVLADRRNFMQDYIKFRFDNGKGFYNTATGEVLYGDFNSFNENQLSNFADQLLAGTGWSAVEWDVRFTGVDLFKHQNFSRDALTQFSVQNLKVFNKIYDRFNAGEAKISVDVGSSEFFCGLLCDALLECGTGFTQTDSTITIDAATLNPDAVLLRVAGFNDATETEPQSSSEPPKQVAARIDEQGLPMRGAINNFENEVTQAKTTAREQQQSVSQSAPLTKR